ncbi:FAD-dependent oxidoreductase [Phenylobacterium sp.]|uniref:FAD-dependent oxidoreductase n=1 Tax=Phenylobacterium sp. TaxID=1871053 RepID=UPI002F9371F1
MTASHIHHRRAVLGGGAALGLAALGGCATTAPAPAPTPSAPTFRSRPQLGRLDARPDRIMDITVCLRPFRPAGPRLDAETVGDKLVAHNYGHGGSGWSLAWGSAEIAVRQALGPGYREIAVIGCGALGLTAAVTAQRAGARVTIYAKEVMPDVRSARATGVWSPDSRIALAAAIAPGFPAQWEAMTRRSYQTWLGYLGLPGEPVGFIDRYMLWDDDVVGRRDPIGFAHLDRRLAGLAPATVAVPAGEHPFRQRSVRRVALPLFNIHALGRLLLGEFLQAGGRLEMAEFHTPADLARLKEKAVVNCTGYGARTLWKDETLVPVRGQIAWLTPQPEVTYGVNYQGVTMLSRRDGVVIQQTGPDDGWGWNDANETPDRAEAEAAVATIASVYG